ncbi:unnamed protein product [Vicia faba]|uniref:Aminoacyl-tRNA synthetase class II (G/ P/ S/T) domain-containing protein n=1 Tax=Vicia faba TaxID=3906 RepID=A0AAV1AY74_VICFA|nr:unnamed protein product [Vicia faba]
MMIFFIYLKDDAHIFCRESQVKDEVRKALDFIDYVYQIFGFTYELKLSTRPENKLGDDETWDRAESALKEALDEFGKPWQLNEGDGAFYGPKIDISVSDALSRKFQCATLQGLESPADGRRSSESSYRIGDNGTSGGTN